METIVTIIGFVLFSVLMDAFESRKKKKRRDAPLPQPDTHPERARRRAQRPRQPAPDPVTPPPRQMPRVQTAPPAHAAALSAPAAPVLEREAERHFPDPAQLYSTALLDAVAYAEILQPPKAYQYMATRSCTGRWPENRR